MRHTLAIISLIAILAPGCASHRVQLTAAPDQETIIRDGLPSLVSKKKHIVMLRPNSTLLRGSSRPAFTLAVMNLGKKPENLFESSISASQSIDGKSHVMKVFSYAELVREEETRQAIAALGVAFSGAARAYSAANAGYVSHTGSVYSSGPYGSSYGTYHGTSYDPARAQLAQQAASAQTQFDMATVQAEGEKNLAALQNTILKDNTVMPGEWIGGTVVLDVPQSDATTKPYTITVNFAGEQHEFSVAQIVQ